MNRAFDVLSLLIEIANGCVFYLVLRTFMPMRKNIAARGIALFLAIGISSITIFFHDTINILGVLVGFLIYMAVFFKGDMAPKLSIVFILYPMLVSLNFLTEDISGRIFFSLADQTLLISTAIHTVSLAVRPLIWFAVLRITRRWTENIIGLLNTKMWLLLDSICASVLASLLVVLNYVSFENSMLSYPVAVAGMVTVVGCLYLIAYIVGTMQQGAQLEQLQREYQYYEDKLKDEERVRAVYHDMKNHLLLLQAEHSDSNVQQMIASLQSQIEGYENYYATGNTFLDVIIRDKAEKAREYDIDFSAMLRFESGGFLDPLDISAIFGNALDNAIEASLKLPVSQRMITAKADRVRDMLTIRIENHAADAPDGQMQTRKADKLLHGLGLVNIRRAAEKYGGECAVRQDCPIFSLSILIPIP